MLQKQLITLQGETSCKRRYKPLELVIIIEMSLKHAIQKISVGNETTIYQLHATYSQSNMLWCKMARREV